jgi:hypothetical protein
MSDLVLRLTTKVATQAQELASISEALKITKQEAEDAKNKLIELTSSSSSSSIKPLSSSSSSSSLSLSKSLLSHSKKTKEALIQEINNYENKLKSKSSQITKLINELGIIISLIIYCLTNNILIILDIKNKSYNNLEKNYNDLLYSNMKLTANGNSNIDIDKLIKELDDSKGLIESLKKAIKIMKVAEEESSMKMKLLEDAIMLKTNDISIIGKL